MADAHRHAEAEPLRRAHYAWLLDSGQEERAGAVKEREGDTTAAIGLYMKGARGGRALGCGL